MCCMDGRDLALRYSQDIVNKLKNAKADKSVHKNSLATIKGSSTGTQYRHQGVSMVLNGDTVVL